MTANPITNLDFEAAQISQKILENCNLKEIETLSTNGLGVLQEQGVYALFLYLLAKNKLTQNKDQSKESVAAEKITTELSTSLALLDITIDTYNPKNKQKLMEEVAKIGNDLDRLLLAKAFLGQILMYTRHGAKALNGESE